MGFSLLLFLVLDIGFEGSISIGFEFVVLGFASVFTFFRGIFFFVFESFDIALTVFTLTFAFFLVFVLELMRFLPVSAFVDEPFTTLAGFQT